MKENFKWPNMKDIKKFISTCESCQVFKTNSKPNKARTTTSENPFERVAIDKVGQLSLTDDGNRFIITLQDDLTKFSYAIAILNHEATTIAFKLFTFITLFGIPETIL